MPGPQSSDPISSAGEIAALYDDLVDLSPPERELRLRAAPPALAVEVDSLLRAHDAAGDFLASPLAAADLRSVEPPSPLGSRLGAYRILAEIGRGGMGTVYLAERADGAFEQKVALKRIRGGFVSAWLADRFLQERRLLARLSHPNIARLIDGGLDDSGSPYLLMELAHGEPIDRYCDRRRLTVAARLELFEQVCDAVRHAHSQLVVHRDLKPSNLLVDERGAVKLLDFGIAKLLADDATAADANVPTLGGPPPFTLEYAAPEQVRGLAATTATDVFSLAIVLWELLSGSRPARQAGEAQPSIADVEIAPDAAASRGTTVRRLRRALGGDLAAVIEQALALEPGRRYASVEAFAEDLARVRRREPVRARTSTLAHRLRLFAVRRRLPLTAAAVALVALLFGLATTYWQARIAARERDAARTQAARAEGVERFLVGLFEGADPAEAKGADITARELVERGAARVDRDLAHQPATQIELLQTLARVELSLGLYGQAREMAERGLALARSVHGAGDPAVARALNLLGNALVYEGRPGEAIPRYVEALEIRRARHGIPSVEVAETLNDLAIARHQEADLAGAEQLYREALAAQRRLLAADDPEIATTLSNLAGLLSQRGDFVGAEALAADALAILRARFGDDHPLVASTLGDLAGAARGLGRLADAERLNREALAIQVRLLGPAHPGVSTRFSNLALVLLQQGKFAEAESTLRQVLAIDRASLGPEHRYVAISLDHLASALLGLGRAAESLASSREALAMHRRLLGDDHPAIALSLRRQAEALAALGRIDEALARIDESVSRLEKLPDRDPAELFAARKLRDRLRGTATDASPTPAH